MVQFVNGVREGALRWVFWEPASACLSDSSGEISLTAATASKQHVAQVVRQVEQQVSALKSMVAAAYPNCKWRGQRSGTKRMRSDEALDQEATATTTSSSSTASAALVPTDAAAVAAVESEDGRSAKRSNTNEAGLGCTVS